ncbi:sulfatase-like hydrolase/transferase [Lewinella sp. JB7]|uniref:sulfatase-like hydrolase/transferase n=1 Tax=Lewinella sp. JB7 TaxID=2962887 RepID=UPI0020C984BC|nr:sulfatase-like hydrolase/transferase [Lewinella sp. JB7]MCP9234753.1 sulfatase-like hydrolase/transferase [Lewinella sp. JB7]
MLHRLLPLCLLAVACSGRPSAPTTTESTATPNIVLIFTDDMGYADMGAYGGTHVTTPHLDELAEAGVRFTNFRVAQAVCTASRAALLTGVYPGRLGLRGALDHTAKRGLAPEETTIAEVLRGRGYRTAMVGKWHLGHFSPYLPTDQGFESYLGIPYSHDMWASHPEAWAQKYFPRRVPLLEGATLRDSLSDFTSLNRLYNEAAVRVIENHDATTGPLFLYLAHSLPHVPLAEDPDYLPATGKGLYADVMAEIDAGVGEVRRALEARGMGDNTLIIFSSDNGPWLSYGDHAGRTPFREGKATSFEGGVRVPLITYWPGHTPAGRVSGANLMAIDLLPSLAKLTGAPLPGRELSGHERLSDFLGITAGDSPTPYAIYWLDSLEAVVSADGRYKLHFPHPYSSQEGQPAATGGMPVPYRRDSIGRSLFDLREDPGETTDVAAQHPTVVKELTAFADRMRAGDLRSSE